MLANYYLRSSQPDFITADLQLVVEWLRDAAVQVVAPSLCTFALNQNPV